jgi:hypothetical protein
MPLEPTAQARFWRIFRNVPRPMVSAVGTSSGSDRIRTTPAASIATSTGTRMTSGVETRLYFDMVQLLSQLGVMPVPAKN